MSWLICVAVSSVLYNSSGILVMQNRLVVFLSFGIARDMFAKVWLLRKKSEVPKPFNNRFGTSCFLLSFVCAFLN